MRQERMRGNQQEYSMRFVFRTRRDIPSSLFEDIRKEAESAGFHVGAYKDRYGCLRFEFDKSHVPETSFRSMDRYLNGLKEELKIDRAHKIYKASPMLAV